MKSILYKTNKNYYNAVSILFSRIREIQYYLPGHIYNSFEFKYLLTHYTDILGHNRYFRHFLKILDSLSLIFILVQRASIIGRSKQPAE